MTTYKATLALRGVDFKKTIYIEADDLQIAKQEALDMYLNIIRKDVEIRIEQITIKKV